MNAKELTKQICLSSKTMEELYDLVVKNLHQTRNDALEEAAKVAEKLWRGNRHQLPYDEGIDDASEKIAQAIRALKEKI